MRESRGFTMLELLIAAALGLLLGAVIIVLIKNGLVMLEANVYYEQAFLGSIILLAVVVSRVRDLYGGRGGG